MYILGCVIHIYVGAFVYVVGTLDSVNVVGRERDRAQICIDQVKSGV